MDKGKVNHLLRKFRIMGTADRIRFYVQKFKNKKINQEFKVKNPNVALPPDYLIYESFQMNYQKYYTNSIETAEWLTNHFKKYVDLKNKKILDWGCGPGRVIRHLPKVIGNNGCEYFATDYNEKTIKWCSENLEGIHFNKNNLEAKLTYEDNFVDIIYGISIFTHLSEQLHYDWYNELYRILKPGGIMLLTTQGNGFKIKLTTDEIKKFENNELIVRGKTKEGHRTFAAFQPKGFMMNLFGNAEILEHIEVEAKNGIPQQDTWIVKK